MYDYNDSMYQLSHPSMRIAILLESVERPRWEISVVANLILQRYTVNTVS